MSLDPNAIQLGLTGAGLAAMWVLSQRRPRSRTASIATGRPGWVARRRARGGMRHRRDRIGVGYASATHAVHLTARELAHHGAVFGGPGSGKTTFLRLLIEAASERMPVVIVDPKGSPALTDTVRAHKGQIWTLDGKLPADLLDPRPWQVPDLLLEAEDYSAEARAYRDAAHQRALWAAWSLTLDGRPMDLAELRRRLDRDALAAALDGHSGRDPRIGEWLERLEHQRGGLEDSGARGLDRALGILLDGPAMRGSLRACPEALRLEDVFDTRGLVLFSLDERTYPQATSKIAAWVLLAMGRLSRDLPAAAAPGDPRALLLVDEIGALKGAARHLRPLVGRAREDGLAVVLATQGPSDLDKVDDALLPQVVQDTAWQLVFRQGTLDSAAASRMLGVRPDVEEVISSGGRTTHRQVQAYGLARAGVGEHVNVPPSVLENLAVGDAWLRVAAVGERSTGRIERVRVALPTRIHTSDTHSDTASDIKGAQFGRGVYPNLEHTIGARPSRAPLPAGERGLPRAARRHLPPAPPTCPGELCERMGADVLDQVEERWAAASRELGACLVWTGVVDSRDGEYGRLYDPAIKRTDYTHRVVWRRVFGVIPEGLTVDHLCNVTLCQRPDHFELVTKAENTRRQHERRRQARERATSGATPDGRPEGETTGAPSLRSAPKLAIALYAAIDKPAVEPRTVSLEDLAAMLGRFEVLADKRQGRCWSPAKYADGAKSRGNAGVVSVSCLVFDLDRVPPDPARLAGVHWIGHTTHSHSTLAPRWRVVVPLARPVLVKQWTDVWRRARAALCPEADPACKDASRAYWLPAMRQGGDHEATCHPGPLLDARTLPELPAEPKRPELRRMPTAKVVRDATDADHRRGDAYMVRVVGNLAAAAPGGRNAALNAAAWTLGRWVAAGALEQATVEDALYAAAERNGLVADDGQRQCWATIRSGLGAGLGQPVDLDADKRKSSRRAA